MVEGHQRSQGERQVLGQLVLPFHIAKQAGHAAGAPLGNAVEADGKQRVLDIGILKPARDRLGKGHQVLFGQAEGGDDLVVEGFLHEGLDHAVVHGVEHVVITAQERGGHERGVRPIENAHLALLVGLLVVGEDHRKAAVRQGQLAGDVLFGFDHPQGKGLARYQQPVLITQLLPDGFRFVAGIAGNDTVHQRGGKDARLVKPGFKALAQLPQPGQGLDAALEGDTVIVDELHRQDDQALVGGIAECLGALIEELAQLARIGVGRAEIKPVAFVQHNARFGGVAYDKAQGVQPGIGRVLLIFAVGVHRIADRCDRAAHLHGLAVHQSAQQHGVSAVLLVKGVQVTKGYGLNQHDVSVEVCFFIGDIDHVIHKGTKKVAFSELQHTNGPFGGFEHSGIQSIHWDPSSSVSGHLQVPKHVNSYISSRLSYSFLGVASIHRIGIFYFPQFHK